MHTTAGYLLGAAATLKYIFDYHPNDIHACMADIGKESCLLLLMFGLRMIVL